MMAWLCQLLLIMGTPMVLAGQRTDTIVAQKSVSGHDATVPNIIIILLDDVGYGDFGINGHPAKETTNFDHYAQQGVLFTDMYSANPLCSPSRAAMLTGRLPVRNGFYTTNLPGRNAYTPQNIVGGISDNETLIPELLKSKGYRSKIIGKWHLGHQAKYLPLQHGFDEFFGSPNVHFGPYDNVHTPNIPIFHDNLMLGRYFNDFRIDEQTQTANITDWYRVEALKFIDQNAGKTPFFLYFAPDSTHARTYKSQRFANQSKRDCSYGDAVLEVDNAIGDIIRKVESISSIAQNTWVFVSSDNGAPRQSGFEGGSNFPFLCGKETTFEGGIREPTFSWWPGKIRPGTVARGPTSLMDVFMTSLELAGVQPPNGPDYYDSVSLTAAMFNATDDPFRPLFHYRGDRLMAVRYGNYKAHFWAWANGWDEYPAIDFCPGENVSGLTTRTPMNYTQQPVLINLARDSGERFIISPDSEEYQTIVPVIQTIYHRHVDSVVYGHPQLNWCDVSVQHWAPPGCEALGKCLPIPPSNRVLCDWPH